jgi:hypothetical protein
VTSISGGGSGGWTGEGTVAITLLKGVKLPVKVILTNAKLNDCYELLSGTVVTAYDPTWGNVLDVGVIVSQIRDLTNQLSDLYNNYTGTQAEKDKIRATNAQLCAALTDNSLSEAQKQELLADCQAYNTKSETFLACPAPSTNAVDIQKTARVADGGSCSVTPEELVSGVNAFQAKADGFAQPDAPKPTPNDYFSSKGELKRAMTFYSVVPTKVVELAQNDKLNIRNFGADFFNRYGNELLFFTKGAKSYFPYPYKSSQPASEYIEDKDEGKYPLTLVTSALAEVFTVKYTKQPISGCTMEVFKTKLKADGTLDGPKVSVWKTNSDCGATDEFLSNYGQGLKTVLNANNQQADVYLYDCAKPNQYVHVTADKSEVLTGKPEETRPGSANVLVWACWNSQTNRWSSVKTGFRVSPVLHPNFTAKGVSLAGINGLLDRKVTTVLESRSTEVSATGGTNTDYSGAITDAAEGQFKYKDSNLFAFIVGLKEISGKLIEAAKVPESVWNPAAPGYTTSIVKAPAVLAGGADQTLEELTDGLQFVDLALTIAAEPKKAKEIWDGIRKIKPTEAIKSIIKDHVAIYQAGGPKAWYQGGRDGVTLATMWKGLVSLAGKVATGVKEAGGTIIALTTGATKVADDVLDWLAKLQKKFKALNKSDLFQDFKADFADKPDLLEKFDTDALNVKAWEILKDAGKTDLKLDATTLQKVTQLLADPKVRQALGTNYADELTKIAQAHGGFSGVKSLANHLEDVRLFCNKFSGKEGFNDMVATLKYRNRNVQDGMQHVLNQINRSDFDASGVKRFDMAFVEEGFDCPRQQCKFDVEMTGSEPRFYEFKSYKDAAKIPSNQFMAYISRVGRLEEMQYIFNVAKLSENQARTGMETFMKANRETIFANMNTSLKQRLNLFDSTDLTDSKISEMASKFVFSK